MPQVARIRIQKDYLQRTIQMQDLQTWFSKVSIIFHEEHGIIPPLKGMSYMGLTDIEDWAEEEDLDTETRRRALMQRELPVGGV